MKNIKGFEIYKLKNYNLHINQNENGTFNVFVLDKNLKITATPNSVKCYYKNLSYQELKILKKDLKERLDNGN